MKRMSSRPRRPLTVRNCTCAASLALLCGTAFAQPAGVRLVNHQSPPGGNGQTWPTAYNDLQDALAEAHANQAVQQIWVAQGTYRPAPDATAPNVEAATFQLRSGLALYGGFAGGETALEQRDFETNITILSGDYGMNLRAWHVVLAEATDLTAVLDGFTISGGCATELSPRGPNGGGVLIQNGVATIRNAIIRENSARRVASSLCIGDGGGIAGSGAFQNCIFVDNLALGFGGGARGGGEFTDCLFLDNFAACGGGGFSGSGTFENCEFRANRAGNHDRGGGAVAGDGLFIACDFLANECSFYAGAASGGGTFIDCTFINNRADTGALSYGTFNLIDCYLEGSGGHYSVGFYSAAINAQRTIFDSNGTFVDCSIDAESCTISGAYDSLGGLFSIASTGHLRLVGCLLRDNTVPYILSGGDRPVEFINSTVLNNHTGWYQPHPAIVVSHTASVVRIHNSILWNNGGSTQADQITLTAGTLDIQNSVIQGWTGSLGGAGNFGFDPLFADGHGRLAPGSPCIDSGNNTLVSTGITTDLDGNPRFVDDPGTPNNGIGAPPVDIGAYEFQGTTCYANCDQSTTPPILNVDDFTCFIDRFAHDHPLANCDQSTTPPILNVDDFTCFINAFAAGCP